MRQINCRGIIISIDRDILKYFPRIQNILKNQNRYAPLQTPINIDPMIMTELFNFHIMPCYRIPDKYIINVKQLAKYMDYEILITLTSNQKMIDNIYRINEITFSEKIQKRYNAGSKTYGLKYSTHNFVRKYIIVKVSGTEIKLTFDGLPQDILGYNYDSDTNNLNYDNIINYRINDKSLDILNAMLYNSLLEIKSNLSFDIIYEKKCSDY